MIPTIQDFTYWQERRAPQWARAMLDKRNKGSIWGQPDYSQLDSLVNAHAGIRETNAERAAHNLLNVLRMIRKQGANMQAELARIANSPGTVIDPERRARYARLWLKRSTRRTASDLGYLHSLIAETDTFFFDAGLEPTNDEQRKCILDPARCTEALGMLDDWQARLCLPARLRERLADVVAARGKSKKG